MHDYFKSYRNFNDKKCTFTHFLLLFTITKVESQIDYLLKKILRENCNFGSKIIKNSKGNCNFGSKIIKIFESNKIIFWSSKLIIVGLGEDHQQHPAVNTGGVSKWRVAVAVGVSDALVMTPNT